MAGIVHELEQKGLHEQVRQEAANAGGPPGGGGRPPQGPNGGGGWRARGAARLPPLLVGRGAERRRPNPRLAALRRADRGGGPPNTVPVPPAGP